MLVDVPVAQGVDVYVFAGPAMLDAVERYNLFSGGGVVPPVVGAGHSLPGLCEIRRGGIARARQPHSRRAHAVRRLGRGTGLAIEVVFLLVHVEHQPVSRPGRFYHQDARHELSDEFLGARLYASESSPIYEELKPWAGNYQVWNDWCRILRVHRAGRSFSSNRTRRCSAAMSRA